MAGSGGAPPPPPMMGMNAPPLGIRKNCFEIVNQQLFFSTILRSTTTA
jgi:hypothetical protein